MNSQTAESIDALCKSNSLDDTLKIFINTTMLISLIIYWNIILDVRCGETTNEVIFFVDCGPHKVLIVNK